MQIRHFQLNNVYKLLLAEIKKFTELDARVKSRAKVAISFTEVE